VTGGATGKGLGCCADAAGQGRTKGLDAFFKNATKEESWQDDQERGQVQRFKHLVGTLKETLKDVKVLLAGEAPESDAYIVGRTEAGWAGLKTRVVQT
jgi:hypothetical protein